MTDEILSIDNLHKRFAEKTVLCGITASVQRAEVIGLLGLNGAGKTTLLETVLGFALPDSGQVRLFGHASSAIHDDPVKQRIGFVPQQDELLDDLKGKEYLALLEAFYQKWNKQLVRRLAGEWRVPLDTQIRTLSLGQRQKLSILAALGHEPALLVLDEPAASLDPVARRQFLRQIIDLTSEGECTVLFSTHIVSDLERVASRVWIMKDGALQVDESLDTLKERTVRVQLSAGTRLPSGFDDDGLLHRRKHKGTTTLVFGNWSSQRQERLLGSIASASVVSLSLEDIFLELQS